MSESESWVSARSFSVNALRLFEWHPELYIQCELSILSLLSINRMSELLNDLVKRFASDRPIGDINNVFLEKELKFCEIKKVL